MREHLWHSNFHPNVANNMGDVATLEKREIALIVSSGDYLFNIRRLEVGMAPFA